MDIRRLRQDIIRDEGIKYEVYLDHLGFKTFGVGHKIVDGDPEYLLPPGTSVPHERVWECFDHDLGRKINQTKDLFEPYWTIWPSEVREILVNMCFNLGKHGLSKFVNMRTALERGDWKLAAAEGRDSLWYSQVPNRAERLMTRLENVA
jgi:lysozyme